MEEKPLWASETGAPSDYQQSPCHWHFNVSMWSPLSGF